MIMFDWLRQNWVDLAVAAALVWHVRDGYRRGLLALSFEFVGFLVSLAGGFFLYGFVADLLVTHAGMARPFAKPAGFFIAWATVEIVYDQAAWQLFKRIPARVRQARMNRLLGMAPGALDGTLLVAILLSLFVALPMPAALKDDVMGSRLGGPLVRSTERLNGMMASVFGGAARETLAFLTIREGSSDSVPLRFTAKDFAPDAELERKMLDLVNAERTSRGLAALRPDPAITAVARLHSADMLARGYFSHVSPEGETPADRADSGGISYFVYGENLAYAPDLAIAHNGLMDSPGHRANILGEQFRRIGIGIQDAGFYGLMITQNFAD